MQNVWLKQTWELIFRKMEVIFCKMFVWTKHQNWFSVKRIPTQPNTWIYFPFQKIAFLENEIFFGNAFTRTKRSLILTYFISLVNFFFFFLESFNLWRSLLIKSSLLSDQATNRFLVYAEIEPQISYSTIRD